MPAADITGLEFTKTYYIVLDEAGDYHALTSYNDSLADVYIPVGSVVTVSLDGTGGAGGGGGTGGGGDGGPRLPKTELG